MSIGSGRGAGISVLSYSGGSANSVLPLHQRCGSLHYRHSLRGPSLGLRDGARPCALPNVRLNRQARVYPRRGRKPLRATRPPQPLAPPMHPFRVRQSEALQRRRSPAADTHRARSFTADTDGEASSGSGRLRRSSLERDPIGWRPNVSAAALPLGHASPGAHTPSCALDGRLGLRSGPDRSPPGQRVTAVQTATS
jgi:hypothetical protein